MKMTFTQYINNPLGEKNSVVTNRGMYQKMYRDKLDKILLREGGKVKYTLYKSRDSYFVHFKIPSEIVEKFYYDTVIEFYPENGLIAKSASLKDYCVRFYSNDPAFVYTFAYAFIKNKIFIEDLLPKMSSKARTIRAKEKNPDSLVGYVKSLFFAYLLINDYGLFSKTLYDTTAMPYDKRALRRAIDHADDKVRKRQEEDIKIRKRTRKENASRFDAKENNTSNTTSTNRIKKTKNVSRVTSIKSVKTSKKI